MSVQDYASGAAQSAKENVKGAAENVQERASDLADDAKVRGLCPRQPRLADMQGCCSA